MTARTMRNARRVDPLHVVVAVVSVAAFIGWAGPLPVRRTALVEGWETVFLALCVQATPFIVLGAAISAVLAAVPASALVRVVPRRPALAIPAAALMGLLLPGCECGSVLAASGLMRRGVPVGPALAVMLAAPAANPVVLAATAAAFPGRPEIVLARLVAALVVATSAAAIAQTRFGAGVALRETSACAHTHPVSRATTVAVADLARSLGLVVIAAAAAAAVDVLAPRALLDDLGGTFVGAVATMAILAVLLAVCSQADAFVASSLGSFGATAQLTFMVVGPVVDLKLIGMQTGAFGGWFAARLAGTCFTISIVVSLVVGVVLL